MAVEAMGNQIRLPQGDTGAVRFLVDETKLTKENVGVFTLARRDGAAILRKIIEPDIPENMFRMAFVHADTASLKPDTYDWSFRVVRGGQFDGNGKLVSAVEQHTAVLSGKLIVSAIAGGVR